MKLVMTVMVRDEVDIVAAMIDHHLEQGVDVIIVTDNGSIDGTAEILEGYAARGDIDLRHDPVQRKQQSTVVTQMARDAYTIYEADWVINADADEFYIPLDRSLTLNQVFQKISKEYQAFLVPVVNLTGVPALRGSGLQRLIYRDSRPQEELEAAGILAHPTPNAIHIGHPDVSVIQGNHLVSLASYGAPEAALGLEVLHLPWRSWDQYSHKVEISGRAYESNPDLTPSPNHHGMRDYARLKLGGLLPYYLMRHPSDAALDGRAPNEHLVVDRYLADRIESPVADEPFDESVNVARKAFALAWASDRAQLTSRVQKPLNAEIEQLHREIEQLHEEMELSQAESDERVRRLEERLARSEQETDAYRRRLVVRLADKLGRLRRHRR